MKAEVLYNDLKGSVAADMSDDLALEGFLTSRGVDSDRYRPVGVKVYVAYDDCFDVSIITVDIDKSTEEKRHLVKIDFPNAVTKDDFFSLFERMEIIICEEGYVGKEIDESISFDKIINEESL
jgi:hypothetical protein